jgi:hypothetical protein
LGRLTPDVPPRVLSSFALVPVFAVEPPLLAVLLWGPSLGVVAAFGRPSGLGGGLDRRACAVAFPFPFPGVADAAPANPTVPAINTIALSSANNHEIRVRIGTFPS